jgi:hypothetical protein
MELERDTVLEMLRKNIMSVTFTKVDGTERTMKCTLLPEYVPVPQGHAMKESTAQNISVWDIDAAGWRSFRLPFVKSFTVAS